MTMSHVTLPPPARDLPRITLAVLFIVLMIVASLWVLRPFIAATLWATTVVVGTWPMMVGLESRFGGRRGLAVTVMTGIMLLLLIVPLVFAISTIVDHADDIVQWVQAAVKAGVPSPPEWVGRIPLVGSRLLRRWQQLATTGQEELATQAVPYALTVVHWVAGQAGAFGALLVHFLLTS
jgi:predicted PurR-regulated permease PerM